MKKWIEANLLQIIIIIVSITFGYAHFTADIKANASDIEKLEVRQLLYEQKLDKAILLLERIDERSKKWK